MICVFTEGFNGVAEGDSRSFFNRPEGVDSPLNAGRIVAGLATGTMSRIDLHIRPKLLAEDFCCASLEWQDSGVD
jgi:hypothetical protein